MMAMERVSPYEVRELLLRCFASQNGDRFAAQERALGLTPDDRSGPGAIEMMVRLAFQQVGGDFDTPSRAALTRVINLLSERSLEWGVEPEAVFECHTTMMQRIACVDDTPRYPEPGPEPLQN